LEPKQLACNKKAVSTFKKQLQTEQSFHFGATWPKGWAHNKEAVGAFNKQLQTELFFHFRAEAIGLQHRSSERL